MTRDQRLKEQAQALGIDLGKPLKVGGRYTPAVRHGDAVYISGQVPRIADKIAVAGRAGDSVSMEHARYAACICAVRALAFLMQHAGSLDHVRSLLQMNVYVRCSEEFTAHSEVADAASELMASVMGEAGMHARTTLGVLQLPKGAVVELDLTAALLKTG